MKRVSILLMAIVLGYTASAQSQYNISAGSGKQCVGEEITFSHDLPNGYDTFNWDLGDGTTSTESTVKHQYAEAGTYDIVLNSSRGGEGIKLTLSVTINALPEVDFKIDTTAQRKVFIFKAESNVSSYKYKWDFGDDKPDTTGLEVVHKYEAPGTYEVKLITSDEKGCSSTATLETTVKPDNKVPNVFTPNGDGQNDFFMITATNGSKLKLEVFNRWGYKIFSRTGTENIVWDGYNPQGTLVSPGTYFYTITVEEGSTDYDPLNGYITVYY